MESSLLWYDIYLYKLMGLGFELNMYDTCVAKSMVEENNAPSSGIWMIKKSLA